MLRKRYTVVIIGGAGSSAAQRSEVSRHRSERDALLEAQYERERLGSLHGDGTGKYRVVVEREGEIISTGPVADLSGLPTEITQGDPDDELQIGESPTDPGRTYPVLGTSLPPERSAPELPKATPEEPGDTGTSPADEPAGGVAAAGIPLEGSAAPVDEEVPSGPVPEDVLRRFEEAIEREQERRSRKLPPGE
jgi:hypothetical protein